MATKFHINPQGLPGECRAANGRCPFGGEADHFTSAKEAEYAIHERGGPQAYSTLRKASREERERQRQISEAALAEMGAAIKERKEREHFEAVSAAYAERQVELANEAAEKAAGMTTISLPSISRETVANAAKDLMATLRGAKTYEKTIADAKDRAGYADRYFNKGDKQKSASFLDGQTSPASAQVASLTQAALGARTSGTDSTKVMAHATASSNPGSVLDAISARNAAATTPRGLGISAIAKQFN